MVRQTQFLLYFPFANSLERSSLLLQFCIIDDCNQAGSEDVLWQFSYNKQRTLFFQWQKILFLNKLSG